MAGRFMLINFLYGQSVPTWSDGVFSWSPNGNKTRHFNLDCKFCRSLDYGECSNQPYELWQILQIYLALIRYPGCP